MFLLETSITALLNRKEFIATENWRCFLANEKVMLTINFIADLFKTLKFQFFERNF